MKRLFIYIKDLRLFAKMFLVMVFSIVMVTVTVTFSTLKMSERLFIETFSITNSKIVSQIKDNVEAFNDSIVVAVNEMTQSGIIQTILTEEDTSYLGMTQSYYKMNAQMERIQSLIDNYDIGITATGTNGRNFSTNRVYWRIDNEALKEHSITEQAYENPDKMVYHHDKRKGSPPSIIAAKALIDRKKGEVYGVVYLTMLESEFKKIYANYTSDTNDVFIIDGIGNIVSSNHPEMIGREAVELLNDVKDIERNQSTYKKIEYFQSKQILLAEYLPTLDLYVANLIDQELVMDNIVNKKEIIMISISIASIALFLLLITSRRLTKSLTSLVKQISTISKHNFDHYIDGSGSYETKQLATSFNFMLDELHKYIDQLIESQKKQRNAELAALQQQINPHFLYNTLASIKIIVNQGNKEKASEMIHKLISLLQHTIGNISETNTVEQELINMKNYTFINQARYGERIRVNYHISPDCLTIDIPKLIIQPFIENAFFHAFNKKSTGLIHIMIRRADDMLICEVNDNGDGMKVHKDKQLPNDKNSRKLFSGIGVKNVHERIQLLYGDMYGVEIWSEIGKGTCVKISLPIIQPKNNTTF